MKKLIFFIALINAFLIILFLGHQFNVPDTPCYVAGARLIFDLSGKGDCGYRMIKPFPLILSGLFEKITGFDAKYGFFFQNLIFYFLSVFLIFWIIKIVFKNEWQAFLGTIAFITAPPLLFYGLSYLTDMSGWFFGILGVYLTLKLFSEIKKRKYLSFVLGIIMGIGFLFKESALMGPLFFGFYILLGNFNIKEKFSILFGGMIGFFIPVLISSAIVYKYFHYTFLTWYKFNQEKPYGDYYNLVNFLKAVISTLYLYWLFWGIGFLKILIDFLRKKLSPDIFRFTVASGLSIFLWPIWSYPLNRIFYLSSPFFIGIISYGANFFSKKKSLLFIGGIWILNLLVSIIYSYFKIRFLWFLFGIPYLLLFVFFLKKDYPNIFKNIFKKT